jgi:hypothetical protein
MLSLDSDLIDDGQGGRGRRHFVILLSDIQGLKIGFSIIDILSCTLPHNGIPFMTNSIAKERLDKVWNTIDELSH